MLAKESPNKPYIFIHKYMQLLDFFSGGLHVCVWYGIVSPSPISLDLFFNYINFRSYNWFTTIYVCHVWTNKITGKNTSWNNVYEKKRQRGKNLHTFMCNVLTKEVYLPIIACMMY